MRKSILSGDNMLKWKEKKLRKKCMYITFAILITVAVLMCAVASVSNLD